MMMMKMLDAHLTHSKELPFHRLMSSLHNALIFRYLFLKSSSRQRYSYFASCMDMGKDDYTI